MCVCGDLSDAEEGAGVHDLVGCLIALQGSSKLAHIQLHQPIGILCCHGNMTIM